MTISTVTYPIYCSSDFEGAKLRRRAIFYAVLHAKKRHALGCMGLVENLSSPGRCATMHSIPHKPIVLELAESETLTLRRQGLERCFTLLFEQAQACNVDEVAIPVHGWFQSILTVDSTTIPWGVTADELKRIIEATSTLSAVPVRLVITPGQTERERLVR